MAYTDLVSSGVTIAVDTATTYSFAYDSPISQDGSPHIVSMGLQLDGIGAAALVPIGTMGKLITSLRVKVGTNTVIDWDSPFAYAASTSSTTSVAQFSVLAQTLGGEDYFWGQPNGIDNSVLTGFSLPLGLDASKSHRINITVGFDDVSDWLGASGGWASGGPELNVVLHYGVAKEATIVGSSQQFTMSANSTRIVTINGKQGWSMLGVMCVNEAEADNITEIRVNNGQFRALKPDQWRSLFGRTERNPIRAMNTLTSEANTNPNYLVRQAGSLFLDLRRLTAGASIDISVHTTAAVTYRFIPIFVAAISSKTSKAPSQSAISVQSTTATVTSEGSQN